MDEDFMRIFNTSFLEGDDTRHSVAYAGWIAVQLTRIADALGEKVRDERIALTADVMTCVEPLYLEWALRIARQECTLFPVPAELFDILRRIDPPLSAADLGTYDAEAA